jgi:hypothetical protein
MMSLAFEGYTGVPAAAITTANAAGFVAAMNVTFLAALVLGLTGFATSIIGGRRDEENRGARGY